MIPPEPDPPTPTDNTIYLKTEDFIRYDNIGASLDGAPAINVYSKFIYQNVEYSLPQGKAFAFCRGVSCDNKTRIGVVSNNAASISGVSNYVYFNGHKYYYSGSAWIEQTYETPSSSTYALSPANAELQAALGGTTVYDMEWIS